MIDVVIPTFRGAERVASCLAHLGTSTAPWRAVLVDDGSGDGTAEALRAAHPDAQVVALEANSGFPRAANAGLRAARSDVIVLLNDDVHVEPGFLEALTAAFEDRDVGMAAPALLRADATTLEGVGIEADRALAGFSRGWGAAPEAVDALGDHLVGPSGGAAGYRRTALEQVGYFDERIVSYNEDLDLALRLRVAGWRCAAVPGARAVHLGSATFGPRSERQLYAKGFSRAYLLRKYGILRRPGAALHAAVGEVTTSAFQLARDRSTAGVRGRRDGWRAARSVRAELAPGLVNPDISPLEAVRRRRTYRG